MNIYCEECLALNILLKNNLVKSTAYVTDKPDIVYENVAVIYMAILEGGKGIYLFSFTKIVLSKIKT